MQLGVEEQVLLRSVAQKAALYGDFDATDDKGKTRHFYKAYGTLELVHSRIDKRLLNAIAYPQRFQGGIKKRSIVTNAQLHTGKEFVTKLDIKKFFPNVTFRHVYRAFIHMNCTPDVAHLLTELVTADHHLPQGFRTSPKVAALVLFSADNRLLKLLKPLGLNHSFWIDDITISGNQWNDHHLKIMARIFTEEGLRLNKAKQETFTNRQRQLVGGLVVNTGVNTTKSNKRLLRQELYYCREYGVEQHLRRIGWEGDARNYLQSLTGRIEHACAANSANGLLKKELASVWETVKRNERSLAEADYGTIL